MAEYGINRQEAFHKLQKRKEYKWAEDYADLKDQIDRAIEKGQHYVNTCLCDFDLMTTTEKYKVTSQSRWTYRRLLLENYAVVICIKGEPIKRNGDEFFSDTFLHIRWGDKFPLLYNLKNKLLDLRTWQKDINPEFKTSLNVAMTINNTQVATEYKINDQSQNAKKIMLKNKSICLRINTRKPLSLIAKKSTKNNLINKQFSNKQYTRQILIIKKKSKLIHLTVSAKNETRTKLSLRLSSNISESDTLEILKEKESENENTNNQIPEESKLFSASANYEDLKNFLK
ncbi:MAG: hypothetical protein ACOX3H_02520 [Saccharofermentanales bacterium]|jgi:hypothetical protein